MGGTTFSILATAVTLLVGCDKQRADYTRGVSAVCRLHGTHMLKTNVPIEYGLIRLNDWGKARKAASTNSFPNAEECVLGGCIVETPKQALVYVCPQCQEARLNWESEHPWPHEVASSIINSNAVEK